MAIKKSELYSSLWASCNELRGGMDASQYKDYVLTMLFVKYVSDKYSNNNNPFADITIPEGASFEDMVKLKYQTDIGDRINKEILKPIFSINKELDGVELINFNDDKLGQGKEKIDTLSKLIAIFENPALNFKNNRADDDDILGDAYEFLMRHFATESGKSKGQFYTPSEVSRVLASVLDVHKADKPSFSVYDPTCGSGSLLMKVVDKSKHGLTCYGQEKDIATKSLAIMNMWLHNNPSAQIVGGNTLASPKFLENNDLKRFDFVVANPPFSVANWTSGIENPIEDTFERFKDYGVPPEKNGDYAFLLHILASLKSTGKGAVVLPHGILFRGNSEGYIRKNIIQHKWIKGVIGLPANLFYGTGIPACIIILDKENAEDRKGIFFIDASKDFMKDGNKNRLRERDIHKIIDIFNSQKDVPKYARFVEFDEIEQNEYNLNIPRYIDTQEEDDTQDLLAHLRGGIPPKDLKALDNYWNVYPSLKNDLFKPLHGEYQQLSVETSKIKEFIYQHTEFTAYSTELEIVFKEWKERVLPLLSGITNKTAPKKFIVEISEKLLQQYHNRALVDKYAIYQHLMDYWEALMKDDVYLLVEDGWKVTVKREGKTIKWSDLLDKQLVIDKYFAKEQKEILDKIAESDAIQSKITELEEEHTGEEALLDEATNKGKLTKTTLTQFIKENKNNTDNQEAVKIANQLLLLSDEDANLKKKIKAKESELDDLVFEKFKVLTEEEVQDLVINDKWLTTISSSIQNEIDSISQRLTARIKELGERYELTLQDLKAESSALEDKVMGHLEKMGISNF